MLTHGAHSIKFSPALHSIEKKKPLSVEDWLKKCTDAKFACVHHFLFGGLTLDFEILILTPLCFHLCSMPSLKEVDRSERPIEPRKKKRKSNHDVTTTGPAAPSSSELSDIKKEMSTDETAREEEALLAKDVVNDATSSNGRDSHAGPNDSEAIALSGGTTNTNVPDSSSSTLPDSASTPLSAPDNPIYDTLLSTHPWLPPSTSPKDFTPSVCRTLERKFWRELGVGEPAWYGADLQGTLFTPETETWNVGKLPNLLNRLKLRKQLPGVNTPYLYWGMWRSSFCWHVEDMDLYS